MKLQVTGAQAVGARALEQEYVLQARHKVAAAVTAHKLALLPAVGVLAHAITDISL